MVHFQIQFWEVVALRQANDLTVIAFFTFFVLLPLFSLFQPFFLFIFHVSVLHSLSATLLASTFGVNWQLLLS